MKTFLRLITFCYISVLISQIVVGGLFFGLPSAMFFYVLGLSILFFFMPGLLKILHLPDAGPGYVFLSFLLVLICTYVFSIFIPFFSVQATTVSSITFFGISFPSKAIDSMWAMVFSSLMVSVSMMYFNWLSQGKK